MMGPEERELFATGIQAAMASASESSTLDALGWQDALADDPHAATATLFEATGRGRHDVVRARCRAGQGAWRRRLGDPSGSAVGFAPGRVDGGALVVDGLALSARDRAVVVADDGVHIVATSELTVTPITGIDPRLGLLAVAGSTASVASSAADWRGAVATGQRALAHELVGASRTMLQLAREHAVDRVQFDRPIAGFQAVRHRLAECLVAIEAADAAANAAWDDGSPLTATLAKAIAGRSARTVAGHSQQVLAGIGFTTEHPLHHYVRRVLTLDHLLGDSRSLTASLGEDLIQAGHLPRLLPL